MGKLLEAVAGKKALLSDGAWGTFLYKKGLKTGECPDMWSVTHPEVCRDIAASYIAAGADMTETNSFGASPAKLAAYGLAERAYEINEAAAKASRAGAGDRLVLGSIGPTGKLLLMEEISEDEMYDGFATQAKGLAAGGADAICIETMSDITEAELAVRAAKAVTTLDVIATFSFDKGPNGFFTMMGATPEAAAKAMLDAGADIIGTNCGNGIDNMISIVAALRCTFPQSCILVHSNAGLPVIRSGETLYPETPEEMASKTPAMILAGANIVGGCCGTTPEHIAAMRAAIDAM